MDTIPHPPRMPIIGNLHQIAGKDIIGRLLAATKDYYPICELKVFGIKFLVITSVDLAKEVLNGPDYDKYISIPIQNLRKVAGDGLFTAWTHEPNWAKAHNILLPGFGHKAINAYIPIMQQTINQLIAEWSDKTNGQYVDVAGDMTRLTFETIGLCGFDYSFGVFDSEEQHPFIEAMLFALSDAVRDARTLPFVKPFRFAHNARLKRYIEYMNNLLDSIIQKRKSELQEHSDKFDFLQLMLHSKDKKSGKPLTDENIRYQIVTFLVAGHETTASMLSFAIYSLLKNPDCLQKAYEEVDEVLGNDPNRQIDQKDFVKLKYTRQILMESLRLYPPVPAFTRYTPKDSTIGEQQYPVKANQAVYVFNYQLHRDPKHWGDNADQFNPEHFSNEAIRTRDKDAFKAFGHGQRACIGQHFAMLEGTLALAAILQNFEMSLEQGYELQFLESPAMKPKGLRIQLKKRK